MLPFSECGITTDSKRRSKDHSTGKNSNPFMKLTEALCRDLWPEENWGVEYFPVYCTPDVNLAALSEHLITTIVQGYYSNGGGFSTHPAGVSVQGPLNLTVAQREDQADWTRQNIEVDRNREELKAKSNARVERLIKLHNGIMEVICLEEKNKARREKLQAELSGEESEESD